MNDQYSLSNINQVLKNKINNVVPAQHPYVVTGDNISSCVLIFELNYIENLIKIARSKSYLARINNSVILKAEESSNQPKDVLTKQFEIFDDLFDSYVVTTPPPPPPPIEEIIIVEDDECEEYYYDEVDGIFYEQDCSEPYVVEPVTLPVIEPKEDEPEDDFFVVVEQMPQLLGGLAALQGKVSYPKWQEKQELRGESQSSS